jgi:hypothetical protein
VFLFEDKVGPRALKLPATIVFAPDGRWRGSMNASVSVKVFDVSFVDGCSAESASCRGVAMRKSEPMQRYWRVDLLSYKNQIRLALI